MAVVLAGTLIAVYSTIRYDSSQNQSPQILTATDETDSAILKALGFTVGYYGSILQVTGNSTYAKANATAYMNSALQYISSMNPSWGATLNMTSLNLSANWFSNSSISTGQISVLYDLPGLGISGVSYTTSCSLGVQIFNSPSNNQVCLNVTQDGTSPTLNLGAQNFGFYLYAYMNMSWQIVYPSSTPTVFTNGTYLINIPNGIDPSAYVVQVTDDRGLMVQASSFSSYNINFATVGSLQSSPVTIELLQNGTMRWLGQNLQNSTSIRPIPPIPVKAFHVSPVGTTFDLPYQIEDWASQYQVPLGLTSNYTVFSNNQMIVFQVSAAMPQVTVWWNGSDSAVQPSSAFTDTYFSADNPNGGTLTNGNITLQIGYPNSQFQITSNTTGGVTSVTNFMRVNAYNSTYGSGAPNYVIYHGVVRDVVQEEAEWSNGITNCPNVYSQIVLTLPANSTFFTYQCRLIFINSAISRNVTDLSPIQLTTTIAHPQVMTENGTVGGLPYVSNSSGVFYNYGFSNGTWTPHHWSQLINNSTGQGTGIMFTDAANQQLFAFDPMANTTTGGLYANASVPLIEIDPVTSKGPVSFNSSLDITWFGAIATFTNQSPIYTNSGSPTGLWQLVEQPPVVTETPANLNSASITLSPNTGAVGTSVTVSGSGFYANSNITITYDGTNVATTVANASGFIPSGVMFNVPASTAGSSHIVTATDTFADSASAFFTVGPLFSLNPAAGNVGSTITITGSGFAANSTITLSFDGLTLMTSPTSVVSSNTGGFTATFTVPVSVAGTHIVRATDGSNGFAAIFNVTSSISLNPQTGIIGSTVSVSGSGFAANSSITIKFDGTNQNTSPAVVTTGSTGSFSATFQVPASAVGSHTVASVDASNDSASATYTITSPTVSLNPSSGSVGTTVTVSGSSFLPNSALTITYDGTTVATATSTSSGAIPSGVTFTVPASVFGSHTVRVVDASGNAGTATFSVVASINFTPVTGPVGTSITISGQGFAASSTITVKFNGATVTTSPTTVTTNNTGSFSSVTFTVPSSSSGGKPIQVTDAASNAASGTFTVTSSITLNPTSGGIGTTVTITGKGLAASSTITIEYDGATQATSPSSVTSDASGGFSCSFTVPTSTAGAHTVLATDGTNSPTATFTVNTVLQPITVTMSNSAPTATVTVNGGNPSPSTFAADGTTHNINMTAGASFTLSFSNAGNTRYGFAVSGSFSATSNSYVASTTQVSVTAYEQVQNTFSATLSAGNPSPGDTLNLTGTLLGSSATILSLNVGGQSSNSSSAWSDYNTIVTFPTVTTMSNSTQRWTMNGLYSTPALTTGGNTYSQTYYHQCQMTLSYSVSGGGSSYSAPTFTANQFGASAPQTLTTTATGYWFDASSSWNVTNPLTGSGPSERWQTSQSTSGTVSATTIPFTYYHQFQVTPYYTLSDTSSPNVTNVVGYTQFGNATSATPTKGSSGGTAFWADAGTAVTYTSPINGASGERWQVTSGDNGAHTAISSVSSSTNVTVEYYDQYYLTVSSSYGSPTGQGWYNAGSSASFAVTTPASGGTGIQYVFTSWSGSGSGSYNGTSSSQSVTMNNPINETASWQTQYLLTMATNFGTTSPAVGTSWVNASSSVTIAAISPSSGAGEQYVWNGWTGSGTGSYTGTGNNSALVTMNAPINETASWTHQYQLTMATNFGTTSPAVGTSWINAGSQVTIYGVMTNGTNVRYLWAGWTGTGTGSYTGTGNNSALVTMNGPINETASWTCQYQVTFSQTGLDSDAGTITVLTVGSTSYAYNALPSNAWVNSGTSYGWANPVSVSSNEQFTQTAGSNGTVTTYGTISATYQKQWLVSFAVSPSGSGTTSPSGTNVWENAGSLSISATNGTGRKFSMWRSNTGSITFANSYSNSTTATISGSGTITAIFILNHLAIDGVAYGSSGTHGQPTLNLTTTQPNDVIILQITQDHTHTFSPSDTAGLTWTERLSTGPLQTSGGNEEVDEWWAVAPSPLTSDIISWNESGQSNRDTVAIAFAIAGANTTSPFDQSHSGLPYTATGTSGTPTVTGVSTSNANDIIIGLVGYTGTNTNETAATGYNLIASQTYSTSQQWGAAEYETVTSPQSGVSVSWGTNPNASYWTMIVDAIKQAS